MTSIGQRCDRMRTIFAGPTRLDQATTNPAKFAAPTTSAWPGCIGLIPACMYCFAMIMLFCVVRQIAARSGCRMLRGALAVTAAGMV